LLVDLLIDGHSRIRGEVDRRVQVDVLDLDAPQRAYKSDVAILVDHAHDDVKWICPVDGGVPYDVPEVDRTHRRLRQMWFTVPF
jgi:hypothetical protein